MRNGSQDSISLAPFTTFHIGGNARIFIEAKNEKDIENAIVYAREQNLPLFPLGTGSNVLVPDAGVDGVVMKICSNNISFENNGDETILIAEAGTPWKKIVDEAGERNLFGIENLAGIPGTMGGAAVQNIGAYGSELAEVFKYADVINKITGTHERITRDNASFAYRTSLFKKRREYIVIRVALRLSKRVLPNATYSDLVRAKDAGTPLTTPKEIANAICTIRAGKFPNIEEEGTAGSFFKNPIILQSSAKELSARFQGLPIFPQENGMAKISLAWILDKVLSLKGFSKGLVRLYEKQPLVIVARTGATATEVDKFAYEIEKRVFAATGISIEREVEIFSMQ